MKRKLLAVLMAVCMTTTFVGGSTAVWAAQEESTGKDEVIVTMPSKGLWGVLFDTKGVFFCQG